MYDIENIYKAQNIADALQALSQNPKAKIICGGSDVLIRIREGKMAGADLVSIHELPELSGVKMLEDGTIVIGPATSFHDVTYHTLVQQYLPSLGEGVDQVGGPQLRHVATIGGNICNGATSADSAPALLSYNASLTIQSPSGTRTELVETFYKGPGRVNLAQDEIVTEIRIAKKDYEGYFGQTIKYAQRNAMDIATLGVGVTVKLSPDKTKVESFRLAFGVAAPTPIRCHKTEELAAGSPLNQALLDAVGASALTEVKPRSSWRASEAFRRQLVRELSARALKSAVTKAGGVWAE